MKKDPKKNISKEDMEQGLRELIRGDLLFDPWYGWGLLIAIDEIQLQCHILFYGKEGQKFTVDKESALFLKNNITQLLRSYDLAENKEEARKYWSDMYCIF